MSKQSIAIINAKVVNEGSINQQDILIDNGRIKQIDNQIKIDSNTEVIDADGQYLLPGSVSYTHLTLPTILRV